MTNSPVLNRARELLADGDWHDLDWLITEVGKIITPGVALRQNEKDRSTQRRTQRRRRGDHEIPPRKVYRETDVLIAAGKRTIVRRAVTESREFEFDPPFGKSGRRIPRRVRLLQARQEGP